MSDSTIGAYDGLNNQEARTPSSAIVYGVPDPEAKKRLLHKWLISVTRIVLVIIVLAAWQFFGPKIGQLTASSPSAVWSSLVNWAQSGGMADAVGTTMKEVVLGYIIGAAAGVILGALLASALFAAEVFNPLILSAYSLPLIALAPLVVVWFGLFTTPKVILAAVLVFFFVFFSTFDGIRQVDKRLVQSAQLMGASSLQIRRYVIFPAARSNVALGLRVGVPQALLGAVVGEFISASSGVGYEIQYATAQLNIPRVYAALIALLVLALALNACVRFASRGRVGIRHRRG